MASSSALEKVSFNGTDDQWKAMNIASGNESLLKAKGVAEASGKLGELTWTLKDGLLTKALCGEIYEATRRYGRLNWDAPSVQQALRDRESR